MNSLVSVIMPAFNAEKYISEAIQSVLDQSHENLELLIVNDGSTDCTEEIIYEFSDPRIKYFKQENKGVSAARNLGLKKMNGIFFCFLDADDVYPKKSIESRLDIFKQSDDIHFVDGTIQIMDAKLKNILSTKIHNFHGNPHRALIKLDTNCFFGPSWMIRRDYQKKYHMKTGMTHAEDLLFYLTISETGIYKATKEVILYYRVTGSSAMSNLKGLENGYIKLFDEVKQLSLVNLEDLKYLKNRIRRIMFLSYLKELKLISAFNVLFRFYFL